MEALIMQCDKHNRESGMNGSVFIKESAQILAARNLLV